MILYWIIAIETVTLKNHYHKKKKTIITFEEEERKLYFNKMLHIHQHTSLKYMIQLVIEGKNQKNNCLYTIFPYEAKLTYNEGHEE